MLDSPRKKISRGISGVQPFTGFPGHRKAQQEADHRQCGWMILATACCVPWQLLGPKGLTKSPGLGYIMFDQPSRW